MKRLFTLAVLTLIIATLVGSTTLAQSDTPDCAIDDYEALAEVVGYYNDLIVESPDPGKVFVLLQDILDGFQADCTVPVIDPDAEAPASLEGDFTVHTTENFSLAAPSNWIDASDEETVQEAIDSLLEAGGDPAVIRSAQASIDTVEIMLIDAFSGSNVNVAAIPLGVAMPLSDIEAELASVYATMGMEIIETNTMDLPAGEMLKLTIENNMLPDMTMDQVQYLVMDDTTVYTITLTVGSFESEDMAPIFDAIIESFQFE